MKTKKNKHLWDYVLFCTRALQEKEVETGHRYRVSTYVNWTLNHRIEFGSCKTCGKVFFDKELGFNEDYQKHCCSACLNKDPDHVKSVGDSLERRYGKRVPAQIPEFRKKMEDTCERLYGVRNSWQLPKVYELNNTPESKEKRLKSLQAYNLEHHGVSWYVQSDEFKEKTKTTNGTSKEEKSLVEWIKSLLPEDDIEVGTFKVISPLQLDVYISSKKIAIEFNGTYYHSIEHGIDINYHLNKTRRCEEVGIHLIHIWEDEWIYREDDVKSFIREALNEELSIEKYIVGREDGLLEVDRSKFNKCAIPAYYQIVEDTQPDVVLRSKKSKDKYKVADCGRLILKKIE